MLLLYDEVQGVLCLSGHGVASCGLYYELLRPDELAVGASPMAVGAQLGGFRVKSQTGFEQKSPL